MKFQNYPLKQWLPFMTRQRNKEADRLRYHNTPIEVRRERRRRWYLARKEWYKEYRRNRRLQSYGLTAEQFSTMLRQQKGKCKICKEVFGNKICVDHDHRTGKVRGLLCNGCNSVLGQARDSISTLSAAIGYLGMDYSISFGNIKFRKEASNGTQVTV